MRPTSWIIVAWFAATACVVAAVGPACLPVVLRDGLLALIICFGAVGPGLTLLRAIGLGDLEVRWRWLLGFGMGLGALSLAVLGLGWMGMLARPLWLALVGLSVVSSSLELRRDRGQRDVVRDADESGAIPAWTWLVLTIPAGLALAAASLPPGILWPAEGNGYDVLEYHLAVPKEFWQTGRIGYLSHNIYSNFPFGVEMLYLLCMVLRGDAVGAATVAQILNVFIGAMAIAAVWLMGREFSSRTGWAAAVVAGSCPMLCFLSGLAYVENSLILFATLALASVFRASRDGHRSGRWWVVSGLCAGFACGCKYTAIPCVALPLWLAAWPGVSGRRNRIVAFAAGAIAAFLPWLIKNAVYTGNPVFPVARSVFTERTGIWTDEAAARWHAGHLPAPEWRSLGGRLARLGSEIAGSELYGSVSVLGAAAAIVLILRSPTIGAPATTSLVPMVLIALGTLGWWLFASHLYGRFAVALLPVAALAIGLALDRLTQPARLAACVVLAIAAGNLWLTFDFCQRDGLFAVASLPAADRLAWFREGRWPGTAHVPLINKVCDSGGRVLMVAEARSFYLSPCAEYTVIFNRSAFAEAAADKSPQEIGRWLVANQYTHVYVGWSEWARLANSRYGFWPGLSPHVFGAMLEAGVIEVEEQFSIAQDQPPYGTLFRIAPTHD